MNLPGLKINIESLTDEPLGTVERRTLGHVKRSPMVFVLLIKDLEGHELSFLPLLNDSERQRYIAYHKQKDAKRYLLAKAVSKLLLAPFLDLNPTSLQFEYNSNGKPQIVGAQGNLEYNISHTDSVIALAVDAYPIGIDVESIIVINKAEEVGQKVLSEEEQIAVANSLDPKGQFCLYWTRKEAFLKGIGKGIDDDIKQVPAMVGAHQLWENWGAQLTSWHLSSFHLFEDHICTVAYTDGQGKRSPLKYKVEKDFILKLLKKVLNSD